MPRRCFRTGEGVFGKPAFFQSTRAALSLEALVRRLAFSFIGSIRIKVGMATAAAGGGGPDPSDILSVAGSLLGLSRA